MKVSAPGDRFRVTRRDPAMGRVGIVRWHFEEVQTMVLKVAVPAALVRGDVDGGFGPVADAFGHNSVSGSEVGAACAVFKDGRTVVDLWGGYLWDDPRELALRSALYDLLDAGSQLPDARRPSGS